MKALRGLAPIGAAAVLLVSAGLSQAQEMQELNFMSANETSCAPYPQMTAQVFGFGRRKG